MAVERLTKVGEKVIKAGEKVIKVAERDRCGEMADGPVEVG